MRSTLYTVACTLLAVTFSNAAQAQSLMAMLDDCATCQPCVVGYEGVPPGCEYCHNYESTEGHWRDAP